MKKLFTLLALAVMGVGSASADTELAGNWNGGSDWVRYNLSKGPATLYLTAGEYDFKIVIDNTRWHSLSNLNITETTTGTILYENNDNSKVTVSTAGYYVFTNSGWDSYNPKLDVYFPNTTIYFANTLDWSSVYLHSGYWPDNDAFGVTNQYKMRGVQMTEGENNIYSAYIPSEAVEWAVIFSEGKQVNDNQDGYEHFHGTKVAWQGVAFSSNTPLYIPTTENPAEVNNCTYYYYGAWQQYPNYTRTGLTIGNYGTICLPFAATLEGATAYSIAGTTANGVALTEVGTNLVAGTPYIFKATAETLTATYSGTPAASQVGARGLVGTYGGIQLGNFEWSNQSKLYVLSNNVLRQFQGVGTANIGANKAYIYLQDVDPAASANSIVIPFADESTGIEGVSANAKTADMFNLQGQRVSNAQKGLFIVNGKKVIRK